MHTKGPWHETNSMYVDDSKGTRIAQIYNWDTGYTANARLIAAAPELLEALQKIYLGTSEDHTLAVADEAIRKAKEK